MSNTATVETLTAEVRALMIGHRQVTLSVYRQLDFVDEAECEPFGRVNDGKQEQGYGVYVVGRHLSTGALVRAHMKPPMPPSQWNKRVEDDAAQGAFVVGQGRSNRYSTDGWVKADDDGYVSPCGRWRVESYDAIPWRAQGAVIDQVGDYKHVVCIPSSAPVDLALKPGAWTYSDDEQARLTIQKNAREALQVVTRHKARHEELAALPLIVLAGMR